MKHKLTMMFITVISLYGFGWQNLFAKESIVKDLYYDEVVVFDFDNDVFEVVTKLHSNEKNNIRYIVYNKEYKVPMEMDIYAETLTIEKLTDTTYKVYPYSLGESQPFIFNTETKKLEKLFFDMPYTADISYIDYERKIIIGYTGWHYRGLAEDQLLELYVFSTEKQAHYKIAEIRGKFFDVEHIGDTTIEFNNQDGGRVVYDYVNGLKSVKTFQLTELAQPATAPNTNFYISNSVIWLTGIDKKGKSVRQVLDYWVEKFEDMPYFLLSDNINSNILEDTMYGKNVEGGLSILFLACIDKKAVKNQRQRFFVGYTSGFSEKSGGVFTNSLSDSIVSPRTYYNCSSYLKERTKSYPVENLCSLADSSPWVEAVEGYGIGEGFSIKNTDGKVSPTLLIINGYISYEKPYLYKQNSRVKKIKVTGIKSGKSKVLDVYDTPHPQTIDISFITEPEDLRIEIADVYEGAKYDDTCIQYLVPWNREVIPFETCID